MRPRHVTLRRRWPQRYFSGLSHSMKLRREIELLKRRGAPSRVHTTRFSKSPRGALRSTP